MRDEAVALRLGLWIVPKYTKSPGVHRSAFLVPVSHWMNQQHSNPAYRPSPVVSSKLVPPRTKGRPYQTTHTGFDTGFHSVAQASLKPMILLPQPPGLQVCATMPDLRLFLMFWGKIYSLKPFICLKDIVLHTLVHMIT